MRPSPPTAPAAPEGQDRLHRLLERQNYRLAWWRAAADEINWRRFFDVNGLAGVRVEVPEVFEATHRTIFRLYAEGLIDGVRIDHVDGLAYPARILPQAAPPPRRPHRKPPARAAGAQTAILWIEKILAPHERLAADWLTDGTTGYDFMNDAAAVLHDPAGEAPLTALWTTRDRPPRRFRGRGAKPPAARSCAKASAASCSSPPPRCTASPGAT